MYSVVRAGVKCFPSLPPGLKAFYLVIIKSDGKWVSFCCPLPQLSASPFFAICFGVWLFSRVAVDVQCWWYSVWASFNCWDSWFHTPLEDVGLCLFSKPITIRMGDRLGFSNERSEAQGSHRIRRTPPWARGLGTTPVYSLPWNDPDGPFT